LPNRENWENSLPEAVKKRVQNWHVYKK